MEPLVWRKLILALIVVPLGVVLIALAVVNRDPAVLILNPFGGAEPGLSLQAPFFLFLLCAFAIGLVVGGIASWLNQGKWRRTAREEAREARDWRRQADRLEKELVDLHPAGQRPQLPAE
jgi:uncharacterized membrane protein YidH (DUF202 family)